MDVKLIVVGGKHNGQAISVRGPKFFIGRAEDCHLRPKSDLISRHHCAIIIEDELLTVRDFGSKNGTLLNNEQIYGEEDIDNGDVLTVGPLTFKVEVTVNLSGPKKPKVESVGEAAQRTVESAKQPADEDDIDISDWLATEEDPAAANTRTQTNILDKETLAEMLGEPTKDTTLDKQSNEEEEEEDGKIEKKEPGRMGPAMKKPKMVDSQAAAEDTLRHFFHRR